MLGIRYYLIQVIIIEDFVNLLFGFNIDYFAKTNSVNTYSNSNKKNSKAIDQQGDIFSQYDYNNSYSYSKEETQTATGEIARSNNNLKNIKKPFFLYW